MFLPSAAPLYRGVWLLLPCPNDVWVDELIGLHVLFSLPTSVRTRLRFHLLKVACDFLTSRGGGGAMHASIG